MVAPWGSASPFFSTNPLSFGVPAGEERPVVIDMATSVSARGKIILAAKNGTEIPLGWAVDEEGNDTRDPSAALKGVLLPFGGHKGYAVAVMVEVLSGLLSGAGYGPTMNEHYNRHDVPVNSGNLFAAVDVSRFVPLEEVQARGGRHDPNHPFRQGTPRLWGNTTARTNRGTDQGKPDDPGHSPA